MSYFSQRRALRREPPGPEARVCKYGLHLFATHTGSLFGSTSANRPLQFDVMVVVPHYVEHNRNPFVDRILVQPLITAAANGPRRSFRLSRLTRRFVM